MTPIDHDLKGNPIYSHIDLKVSQTPVPLPDVTKAAQVKKGMIDDLPEWLLAAVQKQKVSLHGMTTFTRDLARVNVYSNDRLTYQAAFQNEWLVQQGESIFIYTDAEYKEVMK